jgi:hypothetical protein
MQENVKRDLISILKNSIRALKRNDLTSLREQSNKTVHNSSIYQDKYSISISVVIFTLFKVLEKESAFNDKNWPTTKKLILTELNISKNAIRADKPYILSKSLRKIVQSLKNLDKHAGHFMQEATELSKIKKAYGIYRHGISIGKAADLLGISKWELQPYLGKTRESENPYSQSKPVSERIKIAKDIFNIK